MQLVVQRRPRRLERVHDGEMILQVSADRGIVQDRRDSAIGQGLRGADSRKLQDLRRVHRPRAHDHLAVGGRRSAARCPWTYSTPSTRRPSQRRRLTHAPVCSLTLLRFRCGAQESIGGRPAPAVADRDLVAPEALGLRTVEVIRHRKPELRGRFEPLLAHRVQEGRHVFDVERVLRSWRGPGCRRAARSSRNTAARRPSPSLNYRGRASRHNPPASRGNTPAR